MKVVFIGCVEFSEATLRHLLTMDCPDMEVAGIVTRRQSLFNADFKSLAPLASENNIPLFLAQGNDQESMEKWLRNIGPDVIYCFGWSYLLKTPILALPRIGTIGYHPTALPQHRGRHPIVWALALGLSETGSTFFFMDDEMDSGDILNQHMVPILDTDDASVLYRKLIDTACRQISEFTPQIVSGDYPRRPQEHSKASYWRRRSKADGQIDWNQPARSIHNLVRALARPYAGAHFLHNAEEIKVWKSELIDECPELLDKKPGDMFEAANHELIIKCGEGMLRLVEHDLQKSKTSWA